MIMRAPLLSGLFFEMEDLMAFLLLLGVLMVIVLLIGSKRRNRRRGPGFPEPPASDPAPQVDEMLGRLCAQLDKMERRLDNLETILVDKNGSPKP